MSLPITVYLILAGVLFTLGALTVLLRRNAIIELMGVELMLNAVNLVLVTFSRIHGNLTGQVFAFGNLGRQAKELWRPLPQEAPSLRWVARRYLSSEVVAGHTHRMV